jgi:CRP/FNR family cyclic AMP-dependent transcriptional regulator
MQTVADFAGLKKNVAQYGRGAMIFSQGDPSTDVMYIQNGGVRLSVVNATGKQAVLGILGPGDFLGEGCLSGLPFRIGSATAITPITILRIKKDEMIRVLHADHAFSDRFVSYMISRNIRVEQDLIDQLFNSSEKRLARTLLLLAHYDRQDRPKRTIPRVSQELLAEMVGTTRSRVNVFMNKFRNLGFISYNGTITVNDSLLSVVLDESYAVCSTTPPAAH